MTSIRLLVIGDQHIQLDNFQEIDLLLKNIIELIRSKKPDICVLLGDMLHTHEKVNTMCLNKAYDFVDEIRKYVVTYVIVGNHDMCSNQTFLTDNHWLNGMKEWDNVRIIDKPEQVEIDGNIMTFAPYVYPGRFEEALSFTEGEHGWRQSSVIFAHQEFYGCKMGAITSTEGDKWDTDNPFVISGHIHSKQTPQENIFYPGSALQHAFGESEKNIVCIVTLCENEKREIEEIDLMLPRKKIIYKDVSELEDLSINPDTDDKVKITLSGDLNAFKSVKKTKKYKELIDRGVKVVFKHNKAQRDYISKSVETNIEMKGQAFETILSNLVLEDRNPFLSSIHDLVVNNKNKSPEDYMFL